MTPYRKRKITEEQRLEILKAYGEQGTEAAAVLSRKYGVSENYASQFASTYGITTPRWRGRGRRYKDGRVSKPKARDHEDPRWQWAIERGPVLA